MAHATSLNLESPRSRAAPAIVAGPDGDAQLREALRNCPASTHEAARLFRTSARPEYVPAILQGILSHYVEPDLRERLRTPTDDLRLKEDLGLDSLTLMEIVIRLEDVLQISIRDDELRQLRTVTEVRGLIERTLAAEPNETFNAVDQQKRSTLNS